MELHGSYSNAPSRVVDFSGNEYKAVAAQAGQDQNAYTASVNLIRDVPIRASVKFELPVEVATLRVLSVVYYGGEVQFRDVEITNP